MPLSLPDAEASADAMEREQSRAGANLSEGSSSQSKLKWALVMLPFGYFWFGLIDNLRLEWATDPQYGYGWVVPFLCIGLILRRWREIGNQNQEEVEIGFLKSTNKNATPVFYLPFSILVSFSLLAFLYLPTHLIEAAAPEWRPIQWLLGIEAIGLTLYAIEVGRGRDWLRQLAFPILFFFVAIPWPTLIEAPIIQTLTRVSASTVIEVLSWLGVPAMAHGNVIEVATGIVGVDEACSGIRSFQSSIMISLFFGEFYRLKLSRRLLLLVLAFVFSMTFNVCRMTLLTLIAARQGVPAISKYHDPAGITIAIACTLALWGLVLVLRGSRRRLSGSGAQDSTISTRAPDTILPNTGAQKSLPRQTSTATETLDFAPRLNIGGRTRLSTLNFLAVGLLAWLVLVKFGVALWYYHLESHLKPSLAWTVTLPTSNATYQNMPMSNATRDLLRFDEGRQGEWTGDDGLQWKVFYFNWLPGRVAGYLAKRHTPEICLPATGCILRSGPELTMLTVNGIRLPIRSYVFEAGGKILHVFHCRWEAGAGEDAYVTHESGRFNLIRSIWNGRGIKGQKVVEIIVSGLDDPKELKTALTRQLGQLIVAEKLAVISIGQQPAFNHEAWSAEESYDFIDVYPKSQIPLPPASACPQAAEILAARLLVRDEDAQGTVWTSLTFAG